MAYDKVVDSAQLDADLLTIANAIREKAGTSDALAFPAGFAEAIAAISAGGGGLDFVAGTITPATTNVSVYLPWDKENEPKFWMVYRPDFHSYPTPNNLATNRFLGGVVVLNFGYGYTGSATGIRTGVMVSIYAQSGKGGYSVTTAYPNSGSNLTTDGLFTHSGGTSNSFEAGVTYNYLILEELS